MLTEDLLLDIEIANTKIKDTLNSMYGLVVVCRDKHTAELLHGEIKRLYEYQDDIAAALENTS